MWAIVWWSALRGQTPTDIAGMLKQEEAKRSADATPTELLEENQSSAWIFSYYFSVRRRKDVISPGD